VCAYREWQGVRSHYCGGRQQGLRWQRRSSRGGGMCHRRAEKKHPNAVSNPVSLRSVPWEPNALTVLSQNFSPNGLPGARARDHQLPPHAERITSRRCPFLRPFPRVSLIFDYRSQPPLSLNESDQQSPPKPSFLRHRSPRSPANSPPLSLTGQMRVNVMPSASR
jgi:hypothetical protein